MPPSGTIRIKVERAAAEQGVRLRVDLEMGDANRMRSFVGAGLGVAVLPLSDANAPGPRVAVSELVEPEISHTVLLCWRRERWLSQAARAFVEEVERSGPEPLWSTAP